MIHSCVFLWLVASGDAFYTGDEWDAMICSLACIPVLSASYSPDVYDCHGCDEAQSSL